MVNLADSTQILDYSGRDFAATFERQITQLSQDVPELTDRNHSDGGISLIRLNSREQDQLHFYLDLIFAESFLDTAWFKQDAIRLARLVDCKPKLAAGAYTRLKLTRTNNNVYDDTDISVPKNTSFTREDGIGFVTVQDVIIPVGVMDVYVDAIQGTFVDVRLTQDDFIYTDLTDFPKYNMGKNVAYGTITVSHSNDSLDWTEVDSFWRSRASDYHFSTELFADNFNGEQDTVFLVLGDGSKGHSVPDTGIHLTYIRTDGALGNSGSGVVTIYPNAYVNVIEVTNIVSATGGSDCETHAAFKDRVPEVTRAQRRAVTPEDYEALVKSIPGVADCQAVDRNLLTVYPWEFVALYILPEGGGVTPPLLMTEIKDQLIRWGHLNSWSGRYLVKDAVTVPVDVTARLNVAQGYLVESVRANVIAAINNCFSIPNVAIGSNFSFTLLNVSCNRVPGVNWIEFDTPRADVSINYGEMPVVGNVSVVIA